SRAGRKAARQRGGQRKQQTDRVLQSANARADSLVAQARLKASATTKGAPAYLRRAFRRSGGLQPRLSDEGICPCIGALQHAVGLLLPLPAALTRGLPARPA